MQEKKMNQNGPMNDQQLENVSGGETNLLNQTMPETMVTCSCGHVFLAPFNAARSYKCPVCGEKVTV